MKGKSVVFTGTLATLSREEAKLMLKKAGGNNVGSVSSKTDYLVVGENPGEKREEAKKLGITILSENEFTSLCKSKN